MARIRTIKPEFPQSESMGRVSRDARLCFVMLWTIADDSGRLRGNSRMLASLLFPYDDDAKVGTVALWFAPATPQGDPRRKLEAAYAAGARHGVTRSWHANGRRRTEYLYEHGNLIAAQVWNEAGAPLAEPEARRFAERDFAADAEFFASLERTIAENGPRCD